MDDGSDQITIGYSLWDHNGRQLWSHDRDLRDHADGIMVGNLSGDTKAEARVYLSGSDEGFVMFDIRGNILKHVRAGHTQSPSVAKYRMDVPGLQYASINFWKNPGIVSCLIGTATLEQGEPIHTGAPMLPVNWRGDGQEFILLSGNPREGGMIDGHLRRAVMFPDDRHPDLAANVLDLTGAWDEHNRVDQRSFDRILEGFLTEHGATFVVDNGAFTFLPLWHYLLENRALEYLQEHHCKIYVHTMITGDQALLDTLNGFRELAASAQQLNFVVWVN
jgi:hypothetical protein